MAEVSDDQEALPRSLHPRPREAAFRGPGADGCSGGPDDPPGPALPGWDGAQRPHSACPSRWPSAKGPLLGPPGPASWRAAHVRVAGEGRGALSPREPGGGGALWPEDAPWSWGGGPAAGRLRRSLWEAAAQGGVGPGGLASRGGGDESLIGAWGGPAPDPGHPGLAEQPPACRPLSLPAAGCMGLHEQMPSDPSPQGASGSQAGRRWQGGPQSPRHRKSEPCCEPLPQRGDWADAGPAGLPGAAGGGLHPDGRLRPSGQAGHCVWERPGAAPPGEGPCTGRLPDPDTPLRIYFSEIGLRLNITVGQAPVVA